MAQLGTVATVLGVVGTGISAVGTIAAGRAQQQAAEIEALQLEHKGQEERAQAQQQAAEYRRRKNLALSALQGRAAASGFTATDTSTLNIAGDLASYGTLQEQMAQYGGESRYQGYKSAAAGSRLSGQAARTGSYFDAAGTIVGGASNMFDRFAARRGEAGYGYTGRYS